jgi:hypothetical protein
LLVTGHTTRETANGLGISAKAVETHIGDILRKLDIEGLGEGPSGVREPRRPLPPEGGGTMTVEPFEG